MKLLTMNPRKYASLDSLISSEEIDEITERLIAGLYHSNMLNRNGQNPNLHRLSKK